MNYLTAKESRVEIAWNKRGIAGLRSSLLQKAQDATFHKMDDATAVLIFSVAVFGALPTREWSNAERYIEETCGLLGIETDPTIVMRARLSEETLREDIGDE